MTDHREDKDVGSRISSLETAVGSFDKRFTAIDEVLQDLRRHIGSMGRPQWPLLIAGVGLVLAIGGIFGSGYVRDQNRIEGEVVSSRAKALQDEYSRGRLDGTVEKNTGRIDKLEAAIVEANHALESRFIKTQDERKEQLLALKSDLMREIELIDKRFTALDTALQRESRDLDKTLAETIDSQRNRLDELRVRMNSLEQLALEQIPQNKEQIGRLEERIKNIEGRAPQGVRP